MKQLLIIGSTVLAFGLTLSSPSYGQSRFIVVNGVIQNPVNIAVLDILNGAPFPSGSYWVDFKTGVWGPSYRHLNGAPLGILPGFLEAALMAQMHQRSFMPALPPSRGNDDINFGFSSDGITCIGGDCSFNSF